MSRKTVGYFDKAKGLWRAEVELAPHPVTGERRRRKVSHKSHAGMLRKYHAAIHERDEGAPAIDRTMTVRQWTEHYLAEILPYGKGAKSAKGTAGGIRNYVLGDPKLSSIRLAALEPVDVRRWLRRLEQRDARAKRGGVVVKLAPDTVAKARNLLSAILTAAVREQVIPRNVVGLTDPPVGSGRRRIGDALEPEQVDAVLECSRRGRPAYKVGTKELSGELTPDRFYALAELVLTMGLRQAEALDLRWSDVDLNAGTLRVYVGDDREELAKTKASSRIIPLPAYLVASLRAHRSSQRAERIAAEVWGDPELVFASTIGTRVDARNCLRWWHDLTERAGVGRVRFHASRHTAATIMLNRGVAPELVAAILGHSRITTTLEFYARPNVELLRTATDALDRAYSERRSG